jgi:hypothetical protein
MPSKTDVLRVKLVADGAGKVRAEMLGVDNSFKKIEASSSRLVTGLKSLSGVFGVLSTAAFAGAVKGSIAFADSIDKAADRAGFGAEALQELRFAADQVGVSTQQLDDGLRRFTRRIGVFANEGGGPAAKTFEQLGIAIRDAGGEVRSSEDIFDDVVAKLEDVESAAERSAIAAQLFGDDAGPQLRLLLDQGVIGLQNLRKEARDIGAVLSEDLIENSVQAQDDFAKLANVLKVQFTTALVQLAPVLTKAANGVLALTTAINDFFGLTREAEIKNLQDDIDLLTEKAQRLTEKLKTGISEIRKVAIVRELQETGARIGELTARIEELNKEAEKEPLNDLGASEGAAATAKLNTELEKIQDRLNPLQAKAKAYAAELAVITGSNLGLEEQAELIRKLDQEFADATGGPRKLKDSVKAVNEEIVKTGRAAESEFQKPMERAAENIQRAFGDTFTDLYRNGITKFEDLSDAIRDIMARLAGEITALLVFRPSIGGLGGLGLFGSGAAGATVPPGAGPLGGLLAGGSGLGAGAILGLTGAGALAGLYGSGGFGSTQGRLGGLLGGGAGAYGGLLLASSTALGPLAIPAAALLGSFAGGSFGSLFGGNDKQKFGFTTGSAGLQTPFGGLDITKARNVDGGAIVQGLAQIDETLAALLSPEQIARVRGSLAGTSQFYSVNTFDNESFDVVKTRLVRIIDSVAQNTVASGLLNQIGRDPGNIDQLVQSAAGILEMINLFQDDNAELSEAEQALKAINDQFDALAKSAETLGISTEKVEEKRQQAIVEYTEKAAKEQADAIARAFSGSNSSITRFLDSLKISGAGGLSLGAQAGNAEGLFNSLLSSARTDPTARADLAALLPQYVNLKREQLGSSSGFFEFTSFLDSTLRNLVDQGDTVSTLQDIGSAITDGDNAIVATLQDEIGGLKDQIADLQNDLALLLNAPAA